MMPALASKTCMPAKSLTSPVNRPRSSTGQSTGMPAASQARWSSSPNPGAIWTMPVPSSTATKSSPRTTKAPGVSEKYANSGRKRRPTSSCALHGAEELGTGEHLVVGGEHGRADHDAAPAPVEHRVVEVRSDGESQVRGQGPGRRRPGKQPERSPQQLGPVVNRLQVETDRHRRIDPVPVGVVLAGLEVRQRRLAFPAVGEHPEPLVGEPFVVEALEGPQDALHEREVHGLVGVLEVHPARLTGHVTLPGVGGPCTIWRQ